VLLIHLLVGFAYDYESVLVVLSNLIFVLKIMYFGLCAVIVKSLQALHSTTWHDTFLGLWIATLRLVQRVCVSNVEAISI